jgi:hypothetical protein
MTRALAPWICGIFVALGLACSEEAAPPDAGAAVDSAVVADLGVTADADTTPDTGTAPDAGAEDAAAAPDATTALLTYGAACTMAAECETGVCDRVDMRNICTARCMNGVCPLPNSTCNNRGFCKPN